MNADFLSEWLDRHIWPQVQTMMLNDAYFKLMGVPRTHGRVQRPIAGSLRSDMSPRKRWPFVACAMADEM